MVSARINRQIRTNTSNQEIEDIKKSGTRAAKKALFDAWLVKKVSAHDLGCVSVFSVARADTHRPPPLTFGFKFLI